MRQQAKLRIAGLAKGGEKQAGKQQVAAQAKAGEGEKGTLHKKPETGVAR